MALYIGSKYLDYLACLDLIIVRNHLFICFGAAHSVAYLRVYGVGEIYNCSALRQGYHIALWRESENVLWGKVVLYGADYLLHVVRLLLRLYYLAHPSYAVILFAAAALYALFILPVRGDTVFSHAVHFPCAYLHLKWYALSADNCCVKRLIHIRLRGRDIVLKAVRYRAEHIVYYAEDVIALGYGIYDYSYCVAVVYLVDVFAVAVDLFIYTVIRLYSSVYLRQGVEL